MVLKIKRQKLKPSSHGAALIFSVIIWYIFSAVLIGFFGFPKVIVYIGDVLNIWLFVNAVYKLKSKDYKVSRNMVLLFMIAFAGIALGSSIINMESPLLILWGIRQNFRYFIFYFSCLMFMHEEDIDILLKIVATLFWSSVPLCTYEALFVSYPQEAIVGDYVGGVYYGIQGVNAPLNVILLIYSIYVLLQFFDNKCNFKIMVLTLGAALYMAALAELKVFLVEIAIVVIYAMFRKGISIKSIIILILGILAMSIALNLFVQVNARGRSYYTTEYLSIEGMLQNLFRNSGYDGVGDLNRFNAIPVLINKFFKNDLSGTLFGLGLGNADYSLSFTALQSSFYQEYSWLHYQWFSVSFVFIETGIIGLFFYIMIFISGFTQGRTMISKNSVYHGLYIMMVIMMVIMIVYNPALRNEQCGYILYFILAIPFAMDNSRKRSKRIEKSIGV